VNFRRLAHKFVGRELENSRHRIDGMARFFSGADEQWQDQLVNTQSRFANQLPQSRRLPQAARAVIRKLSSR
jgi:hypothetical protein